MKDELISKDGAYSLHGAARPSNRKASFLKDMRQWVDALYSSGKLNGSLSVTGYSLGGHLATAFNLLYGSKAWLAIPVAQVAVRAANSQTWRVAA